MTRNGIAYRLPVLAHSTDGTDGGAWPTPTASTGGQDTASIRRGKALNLSGAARLWPTPTANEDAAGTPNGKMQKQLGNHPEIRGETPEEWQKGTLNPTWVCWLMGYPLDYLDLDGWQNPELEGLPPEYLTAPKS